MNQYTEIVINTYRASTKLPLFPLIVVLNVNFLLKAPCRLFRLNIKSHYCGRKTQLPIGLSETNPSLGLVKTGANWVSCPVNLDLCPTIGCWGLGWTVSGLFHYRLNPLFLSCWLWKGQRIRILHLETSKMRGPFKIEHLMSLK